MVMAVHVGQFWTDKSTGRRNKVVRIANRGGAGWVYLQKGPGRNDNDAVHFTALEKYYTPSKKQSFNRK